MMTQPLDRLAAPIATSTRTVLQVLNGPAHKSALLVLMVVTVAHWAEHVFQAVEIFALGWPRPLALGLLGMVWPQLVSSEWMHYLYALAMLVGIAVLRPAFTGEARLWWNTALGIQIWHHLEHALLLGQALSGHNLFGAPIPTSVLQLVFPRVELHLFYNAVVTGPMVMGMLLHLRRTPASRLLPLCGCASG